jgi:hypothetical protein
MATITRRQLIQTGAAGSALLALAGCMHAQTPAATFEDAGYRYRVLGGGDRELIAAVAAVMLAGALPLEEPALRAALVRTVRGVDVAVSGLPPGVVDEVRQLFALLEFPLARGLLAGIWNAWSDASPRDVTKFLARWRRSSVGLFRSGYQALHQLIMAAWYGDARAWTRIGYPGPPVS